MASEPKIYETVSVTKLVSDSKIVYEYYKLNDILGVTIPDLDKRLMDLNEKITIISWDGNERLKLEQTLQLDPDEDTISDVYHLSLKGLTIGPDWTLHIKVELPTTVIPCTELFHFYLLVKVDEKWHRIESQYNESESTIKAKFTVHTIVKDITAITKRISEIVTVTKDGFNFVSIKDSRIQVDFPEGSVDREKEFQFQIIPIDLNRFHDYKDCIYTMSDVLSVKYDHDHNPNFNKDVRVQLPVIDTTDKKGIPMIVRFNESEFEVQHIIMSELDNGVISTAVDHFSDVAMLIVDPSSSKSDISSTVSILSGKADYCTFITFVTYQILETKPSIWIECVDSRIADKIAEKRLLENKLKELPLSRSPDMSVLRKERVRIELGGNIDYPRGIGRDCFYLMYDKCAKTNHFVFPLVKRSSMSAPAYGAITYRCCRSQAHHAVHFNSDVPKKNYLVPTGVHSTPTVSRQEEAVPSQQATGIHSTLTIPRREEVVPSQQATGIHSTPTIPKQEERVPSQQDPMFTDRSMMMLSEQFNDYFFNILGIYLGFTTDQIQVMRSKAEKSNLPGNLVILLQWLKNTTTESRFDLLKTAFIRHQRTDVVQRLECVKAENREIGPSEFS